MKQASSRAAVRLHAVVRGRVQGIGYRWFVRKTASSLHISGWVRNAYNGDVELTAEGSKEDLERFVQLLRSGHDLARVDEVQEDWQPVVTDTGHEGFQIKV